MNYVVGIGGMKSWSDSKGKIVKHASCTGMNKAIGEKDILTGNGNGKLE